MYTNPNIDEGTDGAVSGLTKEDKARKRNDFQREIVMQESDLHKKVASKTLIESEIRSLKKEDARIKVEIQAKQGELEKIDQEVVQMDAELRGLKKKLNLI